MTDQPHPVGTRCVVICCPWNAAEVGAEVAIASAHTEHGNFGNTAARAANGLLLQEVEVLNRELGCIGLPCMGGGQLHYHTFYPTRWMVPIDKDPDTGDDRDTEEPWDKQRSNSTPVAA